MTRMGSTFLCKSLPGATVARVDDDEERGTPSFCAEALTPQRAETDGSSLEAAETDSFFSELVRQASSQRAGESTDPLGWLDQQSLDRMLAKFARRRKKAQIAVAITIGLVLALTAGLALRRGGAGRRESATDGCGPRFFTGPSSSA